MKALRDAILAYGRGIDGEILKVDMFLNHRIDTALLFEMGMAFAEYFKEDRPTLVLTVEASGIALAVAAAHALGDIPVVFAKKSTAANQSEDMALAHSYSFTHKCETTLRVDKKYIPIGSRVLIIDDFLAEGNAVSAMTKLAEELGAKVCGVGVAVEKGFQNGGKALRAQGVNLKSLAVIQSIENGEIKLLDD